MPHDSKPDQARNHHRAAEQALADAAEHRKQRDQLLRELRNNDPGTWTYTALAEVIGSSPELIAKIFNPQRR